MTGEVRQFDAIAHEALDRIFVLSSQYDAHILQDPSVVGNAKRAAKAQKISDALGELYQEMGK